MFWLLQFSQDYTVFYHVLNFWFGEWDIYSILVFKVFQIIDFLSLLFSWFSFTEWIGWSNFPWRFLTLRFIFPWVSWFIILKLLLLSIWGWRSSTVMFLFCLVLFYLFSWNLHFSFSRRFFIISPTLTIFWSKSVSRLLLLVLISFLWFWASCLLCCGFFQLRPFNYAFSLTICW